MKSNENITVNLANSLSMFRGSQAIEEVTSDTDLSLYKSKILIGDITYKDYEASFKPIVDILNAKLRLEKIVSLNERISQDLKNLSNVERYIGETIMTPTQNSFKYVEDRIQETPSFIINGDNIICNRKIDDDNVLGPYQEGLFYGINKKDSPLLFDNTYKLLVAAFSKAMLDVSKAISKDYSRFHKTRRLLLDFMDPGIYRFK